MPSGDSTWLEKPPEEWDGDEGYQRLQAFVASIETTNDVGSSNFDVCSDSQSALSWFRDGRSNQTERTPSDIWTHVSCLGQRHRVDVQWVSSHAGVEGNEVADCMVGEAAAL